jgi:hypothetical protein
VFQPERSAVRRAHMRRLPGGWKEAARRFAKDIGENALSALDRAL